MEKMISLVCDNCGKEFERRLAEHKRNAKLGRRVACGRKCQGSLIIGNIPKESIKYDHLIPGSQPDEFSMFRPFIKGIKTRVGERPTKAGDIDLLYLKELWESQGGICPFTGWKLKFLETTGHKLTLTPDRASLDRIDSSKGYVKGNVRFVCWMYQTAKNSFSDEQVKQFCKAVAES